MKLLKLIRRDFITHTASFILALVCILSWRVVSLTYEHTLSLLVSLWEDVQIVAVLGDVPSQDRVDTMASVLDKREDVRAVTVIAPDEGWELIQDEEDLIPALKTVQENPLPYILTISPNVEYIESFASLVNSLHRMPEMADVKYDAKKVKKLGEFAGYFRFIHGSLMWLFVIMCCGFVVILVRFLFIRGLKQYIGHILLQGISGLLGAGAGYIIFTVRVFDMPVKDVVLSADSCIVLAAGACIGWAVSLFAVAAHQSFQKKRSVHVHRK